MVSMRRGVMPDEPSQPREYVVLLTDIDRLRVRHSHRSGVPVEIMVQLECMIDGSWHPARRYDTHVAFHVHTAPWNESADRRVPVPVPGMREALTQAIDD